MHMIHGPCGTGIPYVLCIDGGTCTKHYPKVFSNDTIIEKNILLDTDVGMIIEA